MCRIFRFAIFAFFSCLVSASAQTSPSSDSRLKSIVANKAIRIAYRTDATPFSFKNQKGEPAGFSLDLCQLVTKSIAEQFGIPDIKIEWIPVTVQTRFSAISSGQADLECGSSTITLGRSNDLSIEAYAIALPRGDWALRLAVNKGLASVFRSGLIFAGFKTWFGHMGLQPGVLPRAAWALGALSD